MRSSQAVHKIDYSYPPIGSTIQLTQSGLWPILYEQMFFYMGIDAHDYFNDRTLLWLKAVDPVLRASLLKPTLYGFLTHNEKGWVKISCSPKGFLLIKPAPIQHPSSLKDISIL